MATLMPTPLNEDGITFMLVCVECLSFFEALAVHRPALVETRIDAKPMEMALRAARARDALAW
jgi:hypothetical protein